MPQSPLSLSTHKHNYTSSLRELHSLNKLENNRTLKILAMARKEMEEQKSHLGKDIQAIESNQSKAKKKTRLANQKLKKYFSIRERKEENTQKKQDYQKSVLEKNKESFKRIKEQEQQARKV